MIKQLKITFGGSFQCRLATNSASAGASPRSPFDSHGNLIGGRISTNGWTYAFQETPFDRIIRLSSPRRLRNALMYPWADTVTNMVEVDRGHGLLPESDTLLNKVVSLGNAKFDEAGGGGATFEKLTDFRFSIANLLKGDASPTPQLNGVNQDVGWRLEYLMRKPLRYMRGTNIDATRRRVFDYYEPAASPPYVYRDWYSQVFSMCSIGPSVRLVNVSLPSTNGVRRELGDPRLYNWHLDMQFFKFDGDTLVGNVFGHLLATRP